MSKGEKVEGGIEVRSSRPVEKAERGSPQVRETSDERVVLVSDESTE